MAYDFKKMEKELYLPGNAPELIQVPPMRYVALRGVGDPNREDGTYMRGIPVLYAVAYALKMSGRGGRAIEGFFDYVVPPLEGFWWQPGVEGVDYGDKAGFHWLSVIRLPDFVTREDFDWAVSEASRKKKLDCSMARFTTIDEGLCVQLTHLGPYDDEPASVALMDAFIADNGLVNDFTDVRRHHEIYLSDPRRTAPEKLKTVIRHPIRKK
jgi:hypothetical protein